MSGEPVRLAARALLLGERLEHRSLARSGADITDPVPLATPAGVFAFAFRWGAVVVFGADPATESALVNALKPHVTNPLATPMDETARIEAGAEQDGIDAQGVIRLHDLSLPRLVLVADALAKSAALSQQESEIAATLDWLEPVIVNLRSRGRLVVASRRLLRSIGAALSARSRATARVQAEDKPDLLWDHPELERLHARLADEFELRERSAALDRKLTLIGEATETLLSLIEARRSLGLEAAIVVLVGIEVIHTLYAAFFK
jgi:uncharacterized Rmd1/YagE family protein